MNTSLVWNRDELERHLIKTKSFTVTAKHFNRSKERIRQVAMREIGRERLIEIGIAIQGVQTQCFVCGRPSKPHGSHGRCHRCGDFFRKYGVERSEELIAQHKQAAYRKLPQNQPWSHCSKGHELSRDNLYVSPKGLRICRTCQRERHERALQDPDYRSRQRESVNRYQRKNRELLNQKQRQRYATDPEYRERQRAAWTAYRDKQRAERQRTKVASR